jgi:selenocysteine lyase/cysteine desulfurase
MKKMNNILKENKLLNTRRGFLKSSTFSVLAFLGAGQTQAFSQGIDFKNSMNIDDDKLFAGVRNELMLENNLIYLNTGTLGPSPKAVYDKVTAMMRQLEGNPAAMNFGPMGQEMEKTRAKAAKFFAADEEEIILTRNTTEGISTVCSGIDWQAGDEILTTNHEHGGAETGLNFLAATKGAVINKITMPYPVKSKKQLLDLIKAKITDKTKLLLLSHIETVTGLRWPIKEVSKLIRGQDILFIVDGAQAPGMIDIDVHDMGCDVYACSGHKWIMGPKETGILYMRKGIQDKVNNVFISSNYNSYSASSGTRNAAILIGFGDVMEWHMAIGTKRIEQRCMDLAAYCQQQLNDIEGVNVISSDDPELSTAIVSFTYDKDIKNSEIRKAMGDKNIVIKTLPQYNAIRISNHMFTNNNDVDVFISELKKALA